MAERFEVKDRVVLRETGEVMEVTEIAPPGYEPAPPSTYTVRCGPLGGTQPEEWVFGDRLLMRAP